MHLLKDNLGSLLFYNIELINARSLKNKIHELHYKLSHNLDIVCITETWLNSSISNSVIVSDTNFSIYRKDRVGNREGGGVCILTNNASVLVNPVNLPVKYLSLELIVVDIVSREPQHKGFRLFVAYRPPCNSDSDPNSVSYTTLLCECIESLYPINSTIVLCGDFNFPRINWSSNNNVFTNANSCSGVFINFFLQTCINTVCC